jgi:hypothetical protein
MDTLPHLSGHPGNDTEGLEEASSGMTSARKKMHRVRSTGTIDSFMVGCMATSVDHFLRQTILTSYTLCGAMCS